MKKNNPWDAHVCLVTGATSGIGRAAVRKLAAHGATVLLVGRNRERSEQALREIKQTTGNDRARLFLADFAVQAEVRTLADRVKAATGRLDVLVNNAGTYFASREVTPDGVEKTFAVNHLASFLLTNLLLGRLEASGSARILNVSSEAHRGADIDFDYVRTAGAGRGYSGWNAYAQSKLANILFAYELSRRLDGTGVTANAVHPGMVSTRIWNRNRDFGSRFMRLFKPFMARPSASADALVYLTTSPELAGVTGRYFKKKKETHSSERSYDEALAQRLWQMSAEMTGIFLED